MTTFPPSSQAGLATFRRAPINTYPLDDCPYCDRPMHENDVGLPECVRHGTFEED